MLWQKPLDDALEGIRFQGPIYFPYRFLPSRAEITQIFFRARTFLVQEVRAGDPSLPPVRIGYFPHYSRRGNILVAFKTVGEKDPQTWCTPRASAGL
jgi:hypothetical protein